MRQQSKNKSGNQPWWESLVFCCFLPASGASGLASETPLEMESPLPGPQAAPVHPSKRSHENQQPPWNKPSKPSTSKTKQPPKQPSKHQPKQTITHKIPSKNYVGTQKSPRFQVCGDGARNSDIEPRSTQRGTTTGNHNGESQWGTITNITKHNKFNKFNN